MIGVVYCEGQDDVSALTGIIRATTGVKHRPSERFNKVAAARANRFDFGAFGTLDLIAKRPGADRGARPNRESAIDLATGDLLAPSPSDVDRIGLCVDPEGDSREMLRSAIGPKVPNAMATEWGWVFEGRELVLLPWFVQSPVFDGLPDRHDLERVAIHALQVRDPAAAALVEPWLDQLAGHSEGRRSWKAAMHLFNAVLQPKRTEDGFYAWLFEQPDLAATAIEALKQQPFWMALQRIIPPAP